MRNENKATSVLILIILGRNAFWNQRKSLKSNSPKLFHPVLFKNEGTSTLRTSLKKNFQRRMQHIYLLGKLSKLEMVPKVSPKCFKQKPIEER